MMEKIRVIAALLFLLTFSGCQKVNVPEGTPDCIQKLIYELRQRREIGSVYSLSSSQGKRCFFFRHRATDQAIEVYSEDCECTCSLDLDSDTFQRVWSYE